MKELDLLVENYFTPALNATDILRLVEQVMNEEIYYRDPDPETPEDERYKGPISSPEKVANDIIKFVKRKFPDDYEDADLIFQQGATTLVFTNFGSLKKRHDAIKALADEGYLSEPKIKKGRGMYDSATTNFVDKRKNGTYKPIKVRFNSGTLTAEEKISNRGDVLEGLLGVALFISLKGEVPTKENMIETLKELAAQDDKSPSKKKISKSLTATTTRSFASGDREVDVILNVALNIGNFNDMVNLEKISLLQPEYDYVINYANDDYFQGVSDELIFSSFYPPQTVTINVVGAIEQTTSKADLRILKDDEIVLSQSLKNGSRTLGQVGGRNSENVFAYIDAVFDMKFPDEKKEEYLELLTKICDPTESKRNSYLVSSNIFNHIYNHAVGKLADNDKNYKKHLMKALSKAALGEATGDDKGIELLNFEKNEFRLLDFKKMTSDVILDGLSLAIDFNHKEGFPEDSNPPKLKIFDTDGGTQTKPTDNNILFQFRPKYEANNCYLRFYLEYGNHADAILKKAFDDGQAEKRQKKIDWEENRYSFGDPVDPLPYE
jgi:hypothetical protein